MTTDAAPSSSGMARIWPTARPTAATIRPSMAAVSSNRTVNRTNFWKTIGWVHHDPISESEPRPGVDEEMIHSGIVTYAIILIT